MGVRVELVACQGGTHAGTQVFRVKEWIGAAVTRGVRRFSEKLDWGCVQGISTAVLLHLDVDDVTAEGAPRQQ